MPKKDADRAIVDEAKKRFKRAEDWYGPSRKHWREDLKFSQADAYNHWQWPDNIYDDRDGDALPCLTINKTRQHNLQIINDARQNKTSVKIAPIGDGATYDAAQVFEGLVRHIEYISDAQTAYSTATWFQVQAGLGYLRVCTDYVSPDSFDQEIYIRRVADPMSVYIDPDATQFDRSDANWAFVFDDVPRDVFDQSYPKYKDAAPPEAPLGNTDGWVQEDKVRVAEYYRRTLNPDTLIAYTDADGVRQVARKSKLVEKVGEELAEAILADPETKTRPIQDHTVEWFKIIGDAIVERTIWPGQSIPIVPVIGEEAVIDGKYDCRGHTRSLIDANRMYNYWTSEATAQVALQGKSPWVAAVGSIEGLETYYENANKQNFAVLPFNPYNDSGQLLPPPQRAQPPVMGQAYMQGMQIALNEMQLVSGQYQAEMGAPSNERSGVAIAQRQRQGDNATYHFIDHFAMAVRRVGKIILEVADRVYDTPRTLKILGEDGSETEVQLDPQAAQAHQMMKAKRQGEIDQILFNPAIGQYDVQADVGPSFGTKRQEAFNALMQLAGQSPELMQIGGDLVMRTADFPYANELAERWQRTIPPNITGDAPPPELGQLQTQVQQLQGLLQQAMEELAEAKKKVGDNDAKTRVAEYDSITKRMAVLFEQYPSQKDLAQALHELMLQEHGITLEAAASMLTQPPEGQEAA